MIFHSPLFLFIFLPLTVLFFYQLNKHCNRKAALGWLVFTSFLFYSCRQPAYLVLLLGSILFNYFTGAMLASTSPGKKKIFLLVGIGINISILSYYKYSLFILKNISFLFDYSIEFYHPLLPVAISFFTFQQIIYLVDIYKGETDQPSLLNYLLFVSFFPQLTAGPIVYPKEMLPQFDESDLRFRYSHIAIGGTLIIFGLFKKIVLADNLAYYVSPVFQSAESGNSIPFFYAWQGALAYTFQIYFDFSGYSDMAIGIARLFGIYLPINFNSPYKAGSIIEFWHRWHITLSRFLRVYLYFPLGGNRKGKKRKHFNLILTMLLGGLWHGAGWTFVIWGGLHGISLVINHAWREFKMTDNPKNIIPPVVSTILSYIITISFVIFSWVFFRAETASGALNIIQGLLSFETALLPESISKDFVYQIILLTCSANIIWLCPNLYQIINVKAEQQDLREESLSGSMYKFSFTKKESVILSFIFFIVLLYLLSDQGVGFIYNDF